MRFHTSLPVKSISDTVAFYRVLFESEPVKTKPDYAKFLPPGAALNISFHQNPHAVGPFTDLHLGFEMPDRAALDRAHARLAEAGFITVERETSVCCYASQDKFWVTDPNGYQWEVYLLLEDTEAKFAPAASRDASPTAAAGASSCC
ncbi:ArsI/CadI family heavy metal resistance metalloenzyme [Haliangium sp.]|uniref:ArsI/CadI family heavy metal resistance metalloenzyme n=1 Tax=Haliangium sp. TaxID=2663208 RepID=UPI003D0F206B